MTTESVIDLVTNCENKPSGGSVDELLDVAASVDGLLELANALEKAPRPWSARLIVLAANRLATSGSAEAARLPSAAFDLLKIVGPIGDWSASAGCLNLMKTLAEDHRIEPRDDADRLALLDVLWQCASGEHPNARSASIDFLAGLMDFGRPRSVLGVEGLRSVRLKAERLSSTSSSNDARRDLGELAAMARAAETSDDDRDGDPVE